MQERRGRCLRVVMENPVLIWFTKVVFTQDILWKTTCFTFLSVPMTGIPHFQSDIKSQFDFKRKQKPNVFASREHAFKTLPRKSKHKITAWIASNLWSHPRTSELQEPTLGRETPFNPSQKRPLWQRQDCAWEPRSLPLPLIISFSALSGVIDKGNCKIFD